MLEGKPILKESFKRMKGEDVCLSWLEQDPHAMEEPAVIETPEGLEMKMPPKDLTVADIAKILGEATPVEVIGLSPVSP
jgi:F-box/leucine-rich repeat protein 10/11